MSCVYHPDRDSHAVCDHCDADLCESCTISVEAGGTVCHRCMLALSLQDVKSETTLKEQEEEDRLVGLQEGWRPTYIQSVLAVAAVIILILLALRFYWSQTEHRPQIVLDISSQVELIAGLQEVLEHYSLAHGDRYPDNLYELIPVYLPDLGGNRGALRHIDYNLDESRGYLLRIKSDSPLSGKNLVATPQNIYPLEEEK